MKGCDTSVYSCGARTCIRMILYRRLTGRETYVLSLSFIFGFVYFVFDSLKTFAVWVQRVKYLQHADESFLGLDLRQKVRPRQIFKAVIAEQGASHNVRNDRSYRFFVKPYQAARDKVILDPAWKKVFCLATKYPVIRPRRLARYITIMAKDSGEKKLKLFTICLLRHRRWFDEEYTRGPRVDHVYETSYLTSISVSFVSLILQDRDLRFRSRTVLASWFTLAPLDMIYSFRSRASIRANVNFLYPGSRRASST